MNKLIVSLTESMQFKDFADGSPIQVRAIVPADQKEELKKGDQVQVRYEKEKLLGVIVSDPLSIAPAQDTNREFSLEIERMEE